jgi:hypothetical protein
MFAAVESLLTRAQPSYIALALVVYAASVPLAAVRWRTILRKLGHRVGLDRLILINLAGSFVNNVTPSARTGGEVCRVAAVMREGPSAPDAVTGTASVVYDRLSEVPAVAGLAVAAALSFSGSHGPIAAAIATSLFAVAVVGVGLTWNRWIPSRWASRLGGARLAPSALLVPMAWSVPIWGLEVLRLKAAAAAFGVSVETSQAAALAALTVATGWVPTVGGLGAIEGGLVGGLMVFGVGAADAAAITAVERAISYGVATLAGAGALSFIGGRGLLAAVRGRGQSKRPLSVPLPLE